MQDSWSDLQLFLLLNAAILGAGVTIKYFVVDFLNGEAAKRSLWRDLYQVGGSSNTNDVIE